MKEVIFWLLSLIGIGVIAHEATKSANSDANKQDLTKQAGNYTRQEDDKK